MQHERRRDDRCPAAEGCSVNHISTALHHMQATASVKVWQHCDMACHMGKASNQGCDMQPPSQHSTGSQKCRKMCSKKAPALCNSTSVVSISTGKPSWTSASCISAPKHVISDTRGFWGCILSLLLLLAEAHHAQVKQHKSLVVACKRGCKVPAIGEECTLLHDSLQS